MSLSCCRASRRSAERAPSRVWFLVWVTAQLNATVLSRAQTHEHILRAGVLFCCLATRVLFVTLSINLNPRKHSISISDSFGPGYGTFSFLMGYGYRLLWMCIVTNDVSMDLNEKGFLFLYRQNNKLRVWANLPSDKKRNDFRRDLHRFTAVGWVWMRFYIFIDWLVNSRL